MKNYRELQRIRSTKNNPKLQVSSKNNMVILFSKIDLDTNPFFGDKQSLQYLKRGNNNKELSKEHKKQVKTR